MSVRAVVVAHRETLAAEGIAAALARYPALVPIGVATSAAETERLRERADAVAIDARIPGAGRRSARMLRARACGSWSIGGVVGEDDEGSIVVARDAPVAQLACGAGARHAARASRRRRRSPPRGAGHAAGAKGLVGKQIARALGISPKTVEQHKTERFGASACRTRRLPSPC